MLTEELGDDFSAAPPPLYLVSRRMSILIMTVRQRPFVGLFLASRHLALTKHQHGAMMTTSDRPAPQHQTLLPPPLMLSDGRKNKTYFDIASCPKNVRKLPLRQQSFTRVVSNRVPTGP